MVQYVSAGIINIRLISRRDPKGDPGGNPAMAHPSIISIVVARRRMLRLTPVSPRRHAIPVALKADLTYPFRIQTILQLLVLNDLLKCNCCSI